jgi:hypothetical protein
VRIQEFVRFRDIQQIQPTRLYLVIPAFTLVAPTWGGSSDLLLEMPVGNSYYFTLRQVIRSFGSNIVAAVRYVENSIVTRYKLFDHADAVLYYPLYAGDVIGPNAVIEIWSVNSTDIPLLATTKTLETSVLAFQTSTCTSCCSNPDAFITLVPSAATVLSPGDPCNPFCSNPLTSVYIAGTPPVPVTPTGACCIDGVCSIMTQAVCLAAGGTYIGDGTDCGDTDCKPSSSWPNPTPFPCGSYAEWGPIAIDDPATLEHLYIGVNVGVYGDPISYITALGAAGCLTSWEQEVWDQFLNSGLTFTQAQLVWVNIGITGTNFIGISVFPDFTSPSPVGGYAKSIGLDWYLTVGYCS